MIILSVFAYLLVTLIAFSFFFNLTGLHNAKKEWPRYVEWILIALAFTWPVTTLPIVFFGYGPLNKIFTRYL